jgi:hypothetical protein
LSVTDLEARLASYGNLATSLTLSSKGNGSETSFAHCTLRFDTSTGASKTNDGWAKLRKLSGTTLKGSKLLIEEATPDWQAKRRQDAARPLVSAPKSRQRIPKPITHAAKRDVVLLGTECRRAREGKIVHDSELKKGRKRGWIKGKFGRAICVLKQDIPPGKKGKEHGKLAVLKPTNPDGLQKLWGVLHPKSDQLTAFYDSDDETWHDRRGRIIHEQEITSKKPRIASKSDSMGGRVEIWDDDEEGISQSDRMGLVNNDEYTTAGSSRPDYLPADEAAEEVVIDESTLTSQLAEEKSLAQSVLADMFGGDEVQASMEKTDPALKHHEVEESKRDLKSLFQPGAGDSFTLFDAGEGSEEDTPMPLLDFANDSTIVTVDDDYRSANKTQLGKDRGFGDLQGDISVTSKKSLFPNKTATWPLLLVGSSDEHVRSALLAAFPCFFPSTLPAADKLTADWEATRQEATRDWKRKRREGAKKQRKSAAAAVSAPRR